MHVCQSIAHGIVDVTTAPARQVVEYHVPPTWAVPSFTVFLAALDELGLAYDPATRTGVIVSMPAIPLTPDSVQGSVGDTSRGSVRCVASEVCAAGAVV